MDIPLIDPHWKAALREAPAHILTTMSDYGIGDAREDAQTYVDLSESGDDLDALVSHALERLPVDRRDEAAAEAAKLAFDYLRSIAKRVKPQSSYSIQQLAVWERQAACPPTGVPQVISATLGLSKKLKLYDPRDSDAKATGSMKALEDTLWKQWTGSMADLFRMAPTFFPKVSAQLQKAGAWYRLQWAPDVRRRP